MSLFTTLAESAESVVKVDHPPNAEHPEGWSSQWRVRRVCSADTAAAGMTGLLSAVPPDVLLGLMRGGGTAEEKAAELERALPTMIPQIEAQADKLEAASAEKRAAVLRAGVIAALDGDEWRPVTLLPDGAQPAPELGRLLLWMLPRSVTDACHAEIMRLSTGEGAGGDALRSFRDGDGDAAPAGSGSKPVRKAPARNRRADALSVRAG